jgi:hypothetical protein
LEVRHAGRFFACLGATALSATALAACSSSPTGAPSSRNLGAGVEAASTHLPAQARATVATHVSLAPVANGLTLASQVFKLSPSGPLPAETAITMPLAHAVPKGYGVVVASSETKTGPWSYLPAHLSDNGKDVKFTTRHFSFDEVLDFALDPFISAFKSSFLDIVDGGATTTVSKPTCEGTPAAGAAGYVAGGSNGSMYWCLGMTGSTLLVSLVNNRLYPFELSHGGFALKQSPPIDYTQLSSLTHWGSGKRSVLAPGAGVTLGIQLKAGQSAQLVATYTGLGQSLYQLQVGVDTALELLSRFGLGSGIKSVDAANLLLGSANCAESVGKGPVSLLVNCFSPADLVHAFGPGAGILAAVMVAGPIVAFFKSEGEALGNILTGKNIFRLVVARKSGAPGASAPIVNMPAPGHGTSGYSGTKPAAIFISGDSTNDVYKITWTSWTQSSATGKGTWIYDSCTPDCGDGQLATYPAVITFADPVNGVFTKMTETTSGPYGFTETETYPTQWPNYATQTTTTTITVRPLPPPPCTAAALETAAVSGGTTIESVNSFGCTGTIAYAYVTKTYQGSPITETFVFKAGRGRWVNMGTRGLVCESGEVPQKIYTEACNNN